MTMMMMMVFIIIIIIIIIAIIIISSSVHFVTGNTMYMLWPAVSSLCIVLVCNVSFNYFQNQKLLLSSWKDKRKRFVYSNNSL